MIDKACELGDIEHAYALSRKIFDKEWGVLLKDHEALRKDGKVLGHYFPVSDSLPSI